MNTIPGKLFLCSISLLFIDTQGTCKETSNYYTVIFLIHVHVQHVQVAKPIVILVSLQD